MPRRGRTNGHRSIDIHSHECFRCGQPGHWSNAWYVRGNNLFQVAPIPVEYVNVILQLAGRLIQLTGRICKVRRWPSDPSLNNAARF